MTKTYKHQKSYNAKKLSLTDSELFNYYSDHYPSYYYKNLRCSCKMCRIRPYYNQLKNRAELVELSSEFPEVKVKQRDLLVKDVYFALNN